MGALRILEYKDKELEETVKDYLGTFTHTADQFNPASLKPLIALSLSHNPIIKAADPLNAIRQIAKNCSGKKKTTQKIIAYIFNCLHFYFFTLKRKITRRSCCYCFST